MILLRLATRSVTLNARTSMLFQSNLNTLAKTQTHSYASKPDDPVKFSTSKAKSHNPMDTFIPAKQRAKSPYQIFIVLGSLGVLLTYFFAIRESNSLDMVFDRPLEEHVPNIKEMTLRNQIQKYETMGLDTRKLKLALEEEENKKKDRFNKL